MFDTIGRASARSPRRLGAFALTLALNGGTLGALTWLDSHAVEEVKEVEAAIERPIELLLPRAAPEAPASRTAPRRAAAAPSTEALPPPSTGAQPAPMADPAATDAPTPPGLPVGDGDGAVDGAPEGGPEGGPDAGDSAAEGLGGGGNGVKVVHWSEAKVRVRAEVRPSDYPAAATALRLPDTRCVVRIQIDETGKPYEVVARACPEIFRASAEAIGMRYRFFPVREGARAVRAGFDLTLNFRGP